MSLSNLLKKAKVFDLPKKDIETRESGRLEYISKFPLDKISKLTIDQYAIGTDKNSFCYWLEFKNILFGIGGGNASKFGLYKAKDGQYYSGSRKKKKVLTGDELQIHFNLIKDGIVKALEYAEENKISEIKNLTIPIWNMVLLKILTIYFPDKFITIGSSDVLIECAKDIKVEGIDLTPDNLILINYECKKKLISQEEFNSWDYIKIGTFIWENYLDESKRDYYIIGSKYEENGFKDYFPEMLEKSVIATGFASHIDLSEYYLSSYSEITEFLKEKGEDKNSYNALKYFLMLKQGDRVAIKSSGSPQGNEGFLSIVGIAEVVEKDGKIYEYDSNHLGHLINVKYLQAPVYKEFKLGGYGRTIHKLSKPEHIELIFKGKYEPVDPQDHIPIEAKVIYAYLKKSLSHREIQKKILGKEAPSKGGGFLAMKILHDFEIEGNKKGILNTTPFENEKAMATGKYLEALSMLESHYTEFKPKKPNGIPINLPLNSILYGPPGTGKTYKLKNEYFKLFTDESSKQTAEKFYQELVSNFSWWEIIAASLYDLNKAKVPEISNHYLIKAKDAISTNKNARATIWGTLQAHTVENCSFVKYSNRQVPLLFNKLEDSTWEIKSEILENEAPEIIELVKKSKEYQPILIEKKRFVFTTFHQSFSYEDFIEGIKPLVIEDEQNPEKGKQIIYDIKPGLFRQITKDAIDDPQNDYAIFIDEINRGNIANIFGELITLIEDDKRIGMENYISAKLPYSNDQFGVPKNLYIIGTMNTADRSVEGLDTALRRRFSFIEMNPEPQKLSESEFKCNGIELSKLLTAINARIEKLLDKDYCIGHSYFMTIIDKQNPLQELKEIFQNKILPLLQEYFYGDWGKIMLIIGNGFVEKKVESIKFLSTEQYDDYEEYAEKAIYRFTNPSEWNLDTFKSIYE